SLPVILHCRKAHEEMLSELKAMNDRLEMKIKGVIHCFTGNWKQAQEYLALGFYLGFNGIIFKMDLEEIIKKTLLEKMLIETDCPFLTPPQATSERNEPINVKYVAEKIAEIRGEPINKIAEQTFQNAKILFGI
ncbi:MAG: TatD family hydrolase, partial [Candidatus Gribaldobacteria bacterium]|nr:TatD family hydrolase [Candidatus Gribaldobacteria bacterium]